MKTSAGTVMAALALVTYTVGCATSGTQERAPTTSVQATPDATFYATGVT